MSISEVNTLDDYLRKYGVLLGKKAQDSLSPLHVPGETELPDFQGAVEFARQNNREPFEPQKHVIAAASKMMDTTGNGFIVGEMGTGKTLLGMLAAHTNAKGKPYRAIVLCPDHLIGKWVREIETTVPGARVHRFENWRKVLDLLDKGIRVKKRVVRPGQAGVPEDQKETFETERSVWTEPLGPEWYVLGRNQAKWMPNWIACGESHRGFNGETFSHRSSKPVIVSRQPKTDEKGMPVFDAKGNAVRVPVVDRHFCCPVCGTVPRDKQGVAMSAQDISKKQIRCEGTYLREIPDRAKAEKDGQAAAHNFLRVYRFCDKNGREKAISEKFPDAKPGREVKLGGKHYLAVRCGEPLWNWTNRPYRWAPSRVIHKKMKRAFRYLVIDEVHEQKSDESAQSMAAGKLMAAARHTLALTGTLIGGYANHMFPLMVRMTPDTLRAEGFEWGKDLPFSQMYGRVDRIVTTKLGSDDGPSTSVGKNLNSMRKARSGGTRSERMAVRPGVMPTLFGRHMIGSSMFITLEDMADALPGIHEYVGGPLRNRYPDEDQESYDHYKKFWFDTAVDMDEEVALEYKRVEGILDSVNRELLKKGSMKLLGTTLHTLLAYPDRPFGWEPDFEGEMAVGYYLLPKNYDQANWVSVVQPANLDPTIVRPKERTLIDICKRNVQHGNQCWVYCTMTGKRDVLRRLRGLLEAEGMRVGVLRADTVDPKEREAWIAANGGSFDVVLSHPKLVSTGLDLFSKDTGGHNFNTIIHYETGYNLFDMRQASRRSWRIGQPKECQVYYLHYKGGMQHRAMMLMSRKMAAATALEGEFSTEGLVAMAGEDNAQMALARTLSEQIDGDDVQRNWGKVSSGSKKKPKLDQAIIDSVFDDVVPRPGTPSPLDNLPIEQQLIGETMIAVDNQIDPSEIDDVFEEPAPPHIPVVTPIEDAPKPKARATRKQPRSPLTRADVAKLMADLDDLGMCLEDFL